MNWWCNYTYRIAGCLGSGDKHVNYDSNELIFLIKTQRKYYIMKIKKNMDRSNHEKKTT